MLEQQSSIVHARALSTTTCAVHAPAYQNPPHALPAFGVVVDDRHRRAHGSPLASVSRGFFRFVFCYTLVESCSSQAVCRVGPARVSSPQVDLTPLWPQATSTSRCSAAEQWTGAVDVDETTTCGSRPTDGWNLVDGPGGHHGRSDRAGGAPRRRKLGPRGQGDAVHQFAQALELEIVPGPACARPRHITRRAPVAS